MTQSDVKLNGDEVLIEGDLLKVETPKTRVQDLSASDGTFYGQVSVHGRLGAETLEIREGVESQSLHLNDRLSIGKGVAVVYQPMLRRQDPTRADDGPLEAAPETILENVTTIGPGILVAGDDPVAEGRGVDLTREFDADEWTRTEVAIVPTALEIGLLDIPAPCEVGPEDYPHTSWRGSRNPGIDAEEELRLGQEALIDDLVDFVGTLSLHDEAAFVEALSERLHTWSTVVPIMAPPEHTRWDPPDGHEDIYESDGMTEEHATELSRCLFRALAEAGSLNPSEQRVLFHGILLGLSHNLQLNTAGYRAVSVNSDVVVRGNVYVTGKVVSSGHVRSPFAHWLDLAARLTGWQIDNALSRFALLAEDLGDFLEDEADRFRSSGAVNPRERDPDFVSGPAGMLDEFDYNDLFTDPSPVDEGSTWRLNPLVDRRGLTRWMFDSMTRVAATANEAIQTSVVGHGDRRSIAERGMQRIMSKVLRRKHAPLTTEQSLAVKLVGELGGTWTEHLVSHGASEEAATRVVSAVIGRRKADDPPLTRDELSNVAAALEASGATIRAGRKVENRALLKSIKRTLLTSAGGAP